MLTSKPSRNRDEKPQKRCEASFGRPGKVNKRRIREADEKKKIRGETRRFRKATVSKNRERNRCF